MFEAVLALSVMAAPVFFGAWLLAGYLAGRLAFRRTRGGRRVGARVLLAALALPGLLAAAELLAAGAMWSFGWAFAADRVALGVPPLFLSGVAVLTFSVPRLAGISLSKLRDRRAPVEAADRAAASDPLLVVPIQATTVGAAIFAYTVWFPPGVLSPVTVLVPWGVFISLAAALWIRQQRRHRRMGRPVEVARPRIGFRMLRAFGAGILIFASLAGLLAFSARSSGLPDEFSMTSHESMDYGGGPVVKHGSPHGPANGATSRHGDHGVGDHTPGHGSGMSVSDLTGPHHGTPDRRFTLTARKTTIRLSSGERVEAWTFDGKAPGPELRVRQGDLVQITLLNRDIEDGVTLHWHGVDVPNAEDGVAGLTQNAVMPGDRHTYRFLAEQTGTYWYHSHQVSSEQVKKGLFGAFVVDPKSGISADEDITVAAHGWYGQDEFVSESVSFGTSDTLDRRSIAPGKRVRLRLINTGTYPMGFTISGTPFEVAAIDGTEVNEPERIEGQKLLLAAGGRYDVTFTMPENPVSLHLDGKSGPGILFSRDGDGKVPRAASGPEFDPSDYGRPKPTPFSASSDFDREFEVIMDNRFGFYDGGFNMLWTINGEVFPDTPMQMVREGDLVKTTFVNRSLMDHPMHLHGHHVLVLSRNGEPVTGSPWWADTLNVAPGETYEVAFRADNPGIWMDHCHNLDHAAIGMTMHLAYEGVTTPFTVGGAARNHPE